MKLYGVWAGALLCCGVGLLQAVPDTVFAQAQPRQSAAAAAGATTAQSADSGVTAGPLSLNGLKNATYSGLGHETRALSLRNGGWQGPSAVPSAASRPWVEFLGDLVARGDLDGDGREEAVVVLASNTGGTGVFHHLAVVRHETASLRNVATRFVGDRIQVISLRIDQQRVLLELVRSGPNDPACCPTEVATLQFRLVQGRLTPPIDIAPASSLSVEVLAGQPWRLIAWKRGEPAPSGVSLRYEQGQFRGVAACNGYGASVQAAPSGANLKVGAPFSTRKYCEESTMAIEHRFLNLLPRVNAFGFDAGRLALQYGEGDQAGVMLLERGPGD